MKVRTKQLPNGIPVHHYKLPNGLQLYVLENHSAPVFTYQTWFRVGSKDEKLDPSLKRTGLAHLFEHMMFRGTQNLGDGEFDRVLTRNGVSGENATTWMDRTNYYQSLPSDKLELVMQLESDRMVNLKIDEALLETEKGAVLGEYRMGLDDPDMMAFDKLYDAAFTAHPYRYTTIGTEDEIKSFSKDDAMYFYRKYYSPNNAVILIAGDVDPENALGLVQKYYGQMKEQAIDYGKAPVEPEQTRERRVEFKHPQLTETKLLFGYRTPEARHPDQAPLEVVNSILTTGEGALLQQLWVNSGLAVSVFGSLNQFRDPGLLLMGADLQEDATPDELLTVLDQTLQGLLGPGKVEAQLERAQNQQLLELYQQWEENSGLSSYIGEFIASADDPLFAFEYADRLSQVTADQVRAVIRKYLAPKNRTVVIGVSS